MQIETPFRTRELSRGDVKRIASLYKARRDAGKVKKPMSLFIANFTGGGGSGPLIREAAGCSAV
jgi:hypothetical protein